MSFVVTYLGNELGVVWGKKVRKARPCWVAKGIDHYLTIIIQSSLMFVRLYCRSLLSPVFNAFNLGGWSNNAFVMCAQK